MKQQPFHHNRSALSGSVYILCLCVCVCVYVQVVQSCMSALQQAAAVSDGVGPAIGITAAIPRRRASEVEGNNQIVSAAFRSGTNTAPDCLIMPGRA